MADGKGVIWAAVVREVAAGALPCRRIARARLRLSAISWRCAGESGESHDVEAGAGGAGDDDGEVSGGGKWKGRTVWLEGGGGEGEGGNARGDLEPLPLAPLPRALPAGDLPVPLGVPLEGGCLPPERLPRPFVGIGMGEVAGAG